AAVAPPSGSRRCHVTDRDDKPDDSPRDAALLFNAELDAHRIDPASLNGDPLRDDQLLWIDLQGDAPLPGVLARAGIDEYQLREAPPDSDGVATTEGWTYLHASALCAGTGRKLRSEPLVVAVGAASNIVATY